MLESLRGINETIQYGCQASRAEMLDARMDALHAISVKLRMRSAVSDAMTDVLVIGGGMWHAPWSDVPFLPQARSMRRSS